MRTFHLLVANTLVANVTNNFLWFALTFWVYLETRSVLATAIIGGGYMLLIAVSGMFFGTFVDRHLRRTSMLLSSAVPVTVLRHLVAARVPSLAESEQPTYVREGQDPLRRRPARGSRCTMARSEQRETVPSARVLDIDEVRVMKALTRCGLEAVHPGAVPMSRLAVRSAS